jgi:hypothetical protein
MKNFPTELIAKAETLNTAKKAFEDHWRLLSTSSHFEINKRFWEIMDRFRTIMIRYRLANGGQPYHKMAARELFRLTLVGEIDYDEAVNFVQCYRKLSKELQSQIDRMVGGHFDSGIDVADAMPLAGERYVNDFKAGKHKFSDQYELRKGVGCGHGLPTPKGMSEMDFNNNLLIILRNENHIGTHLDDYAQEYFLLHVESPVDGN